MEKSLTIPESEGKQPYKDLKKIAVWIFANATYQKHTDLLGGAQKRSIEHSKMVSK